MATKIKVGDRVRHKQFGDGVVKFVDSGLTPYAVEFKAKTIWTHTCAGHCKSEYAAWCDKYELTIIKPNSLKSPQIDFMDTEILDVPVRVHYTFEKGYEGKSDSIDITTVTHLGVDVTGFALALHQDQFEAEISKYENADYCPEHDD
jgi:hypothetical protein